MILGVPVINRPDLLARCIASIDIPVELVIVDNSPESFVGELLDSASGWTVPESVFVTEPPANLGVAASWNHIIRTHPREPFWLIANADTEFGPGDLQGLADEMQQPGPRWVGMNGDWRVFGLSAAAVETVGFFDEGFHPCYLEDCDYERRCMLAEVPWYFLEGGSTHVGSAAIRSDERYATRNAVTYPANVRRYIQKWGGSQRGGETFRTPWNRGGHIGDWRLELSRLRDQEW